MFGGQTINGGLEGFLGNASGDFTAETLQALRIAGAVISARQLQRALSLFPGDEAPRDQSMRIELLSAVTQPNRELLDELDDQLYRDVFPIDSNGQESLDELLAALMAQHACEPVQSRVARFDSGR
jgi:hypothetical protein